MSFIQTIAGKIPSRQMGVTDAHEHLIRIGGGEVLHGGTDFLMDSIDAATHEIVLYQEAGGQTIVEMTPCGSGRDVDSLLELGEKTGIQIIATTGFHKAMFYDQSHFLYRYSIEELAELLVQDVTIGIDRNDYSGPIIRRSAAKAGVIKGAASYQVISATEEKVLHAAAAASVQTGFPISVHLERGTMALEVVQILLTDGVRPDNIILSHIDRNPDLYYHSKVAEQGVFLIYDGPGRVKYYPDDVIAKLIEQMISAGFGSQLLVGGDLGRRSYFQSYQGGPGMAYNLKKFMVRLQEMNIHEENIKNILINNPAKAFSNTTEEVLR